MAITYGFLDNKGLIQLENFDIGSGLPGNITVKEINIVESLLSPSVQVMAVLQSDLYRPAGKDFDQFKNKDMTFNLSLKTTGGSGNRTMKVNQKTYRLDNRNFVQNNLSAVEEMIFHAIDETVIEDAKCLVSKSWKCTKPSEIVSNVLQQCLQAEETKVDSADPARDYIAENLHPFRVIAQQAEVALDGDDPSFLHFMTLNEKTGKGVHHFQSLKKLTGEKSVFTYFFSEPTPKSTYENKEAAISFSFPCDFDYLSDLLNGLDENGKNQNSLGTIDQVFKMFTKVMPGGSEACDCGIGQYNYKAAQSNSSTAEQRNSCNLDVESHMLKRQARMGLLEKDKIALRITVPWNPALHAGKVITLEWKNKESSGSDVYGHGDYLISSMMHTIRMGGYAITTMDCVATSVGRGEV